MDYVATSVRILFKKIKNIYGRESSRGVLVTYSAYDVSSYKCLWLKNFRITYVIVNLRASQLTTNPEISAEPCKYPSSFGSGRRVIASYYNNVPTRPRDCWYEYEKEPLTFFRTGVQSAEAVMGKRKIWKHRRWKNDVFRPERKWIKFIMKVSGSVHEAKTHPILCGWREGNGLWHSIHEQVVACNFIGNARIIEQYLYVIKKHIELRTLIVLIFKDRQLLS